MKNSTKFLLVCITIFAIVASYLTFFNSNHEPENAPAAATQSKPASPPPVFVHTVEAKRIKLNPFSDEISTLICFPPSSFATKSNAGATV